MNLHALPLLLAALPSTDWPQWRGPLATGAAPDAVPPLTWSETENVRWKVALPGSGQSTPAIAGDRVFVTSAEPTGAPFEPRPETSPGAHDNAPVTQAQRLLLRAYQRSDGKLLWERTLHESIPHEGAHVSATFASASPLTDGRDVFAFFGSRGLYAVDRDGEPLWSKDLGDMQAKHGHGEGASPFLYGDTLIVNWDHEGPSFLVALDKRDGSERWRVERDEVTSWSTPIVADVDGHLQVLVSGSQRVRGYDFESGELVWECGGLSRNVVASPVYRDGTLYVASSYEIQAMLAIRIAGARGDLSRTDRVLWNRRRSTPYVPSLLLYDDGLFFLHHYQGTLSRVDPATGRETSPPLRTGLREVYASPVGAAGRVYITSRSGTTVVVDAARPDKVLARNVLDDTFGASAALVGNELYLRGESYLYCLAVPK